MTPRYDADGVTIYQQSMDAVLREADLWPTQTVITDPPYLNFHQGQAIAWAETYDEKEDVEWLRGVNWWHRVWVPLVARLVERSDGRAWIFEHLLYLPSLTRVCHLLRWPIRRLWMRGSSGHALILCGHGIGRDQEARVEAAVDAWAGYPRQQRPLIDTLLDISGPGPVLDPFMGRGAVVLAAQARGWPVVGVDISEACCRETIEALHAQQAHQ